MNNETTNQAKGRKMKSQQLIEKFMVKVNGVTMTLNQDEVIGALKQGFTIQLRNAKR